MQATEKNNNLVQVVALALQRKTDQMYLLTRRGPGQSGAGQWEFPGGKIEDGETQTQALVREIKEELCFDLQEKELVFVSEHIEHYINKSVHIFLWKQVIDFNPEFVLTEHDLSVWVPKVQILNYNLSTGDRPFVSRL